VAAFRLLGIPDDPFELRRQKFVDGLRFRAIASGVFLLVFSFLSPPLRSASSPSLMLTADLVILAAINIAYWYVGRARKFPLIDFYIHWIVDLLLISSVLLEVGGIDVPYGCLAYLMIVVTSATFLSKRASFLVASGAAVATVSLGVFQINGTLQPHRMWAVDASFETQVAAILFAVVFYYLFAFLAGTLADQLKDANSALNRATGEIQEQNRLLETKVAARTQELRRRNAEIEEFVHIVTHDLKNVSIGATETTRRLISSEGPTLSDRARRYALHVLEDTRHMNQMLMHLLSIFRISQQEERRERVDLRALVEELVRLQAPRLEAKHIVVGIDNLSSIVADENQLRHVIANLLDNAIKYVGDKGVPAIRISGELRDATYIVSVTDNGVGISEGQLERIFQLYHRGPDQLVAGELQQGEGVGLAICRRMVERWGGRLWAESREGFGSTFYFTVPMSPDVGTDRSAHAYA
jgi:signal transduction histidine kinase